MSHKTAVFLLTFCLEDLSIDVSGVSKSPTIIVLLLTSPFISIQYLLYIFRCSYVGCINVYKGYFVCLTMHEVFYFISSGSILIEIPSHCLCPQRGGDSTSSPREPDFMGRVGGQNKVQKRERMEQVPPQENQEALF